MADISTVSVTKGGNTNTYEIRDVELREKVEILAEQAEEWGKKHLELGLRADFVSGTFTRLGDAEGLNGGTDFDDFPMYRRRRCNLADDGTVNAYLGDANYAVDGSNGQVMVEQPKFYYKVVPVTLNANDNKQLDVAEYWVSGEPLEGYKLHPAFYNTSGQEIDYFYEGAYEGYVNNNKLESISGVTPTGSQTRAMFRTNAANRGTGWRQETIWSMSADQLLMIIEYGKFNMQQAIGNGSVNNDNVLNTGTIDSYGNASYGTTANQTTAVQWRGKENDWGNKNAWIDGINFNGYIPYIANSYNFIDDTTTNYTQLGFNISNNSGKYIGRFGYDENYDWIFIPYGSITGDSTSPVGDVFTSQSSDWRVAALGGIKTNGLSAGAFRWTIQQLSSGTTPSYSARALFVG